MFLRREVLNQWFIGVTIHLVLFCIARELNEKSALLPESVLSADTISTKDTPAGRLFILVIGGLRWDVFQNQSNVSDFTKLLRELGTVGPIYSDNRKTSSSKLPEMATGVVEEATNATGDIFKYSRALYIGPPSVKGLFNNIQEYYCYPDVWENLTVSPNVTKTDEWVFSKWDELTKDPVGKDINLFFFYFSGFNLASQLDGAESNLAVQELKYILDGIEGLYSNTEGLYKDDKTAYLLTSDYAIAEDKDDIEFSLNESFVPLLAWGAGLADISQITTEDLSHLDRKLLLRHNDLTPLISYLSGSAIPPNSFGYAPAIRLRNAEYRAKMLLYNAKQLVALFKGFEKEYRLVTSRWFAPLNDLVINEYFMEIHQSLFRKDYYTSVTKSSDLILLSLDGIRYYRNEECNLLWFCSVLILIPWTAVTLGWILDKIKLTPIIQREMVPEANEENVSSPVKNTSLFKKCFSPLYLVNTVWFLVFCLLFGILLLIGAPLLLSFTAILAVGIFWLASISCWDWARLYKTLMSPDLEIKKGKPMIHLGYFLIFSCCSSLPVVIQVLFSFATMFTSLSDLRHKPSAHLAYWMLSSFSYLILLHYKFVIPFFPVLLISALVWIVWGGTILHWLKVDYLDWPIFIVSFSSIIVITMIPGYSPSASMEMFILRWSPSVLICLVPLIGSLSLPVRLFQICMCLSMSVFLLSLSFEPISLIVISSHLFSWVLLEGFPDFTSFFTSTVYSKVENPYLVWDDVRRCFYFTAYVITSFLVMGNSNDVRGWPTEWSSYFGQTPPCSLYVLVCLKSVPVILIDNILLALLEKKSAIGYMSVILYLMSSASLINFFAIVDKEATLYNQLVFLFALLLKPVAHLFLAPSIFSVLNDGTTSPDDEQNTRPDNGEPTINQTYI